MPGSSVWLCVVERPIQHSRYYGGGDWNGCVFVFLLD
ncbi:unnamed protein product [Brassica oleracea]